MTWTSRADARKVVQPAGAAGAPKNPPPRLFPISSLISIMDSLLQCFPTITPSLSFFLLYFLTNTIYYYSSQSNLLRSPRKDDDDDDDSLLLLSSSFLFSSLFFSFPLLLPTLSFFPFNNLFTNFSVANHLSFGDIENRSILPNFRYLFSLRLKF